ncbi:Nucleotide modification associated domain 3 [Caprobacter fermentans]|uniref:Nucleotide modification associated domain 3 n=1 Tax=Caproicibacter fermentans TaxID=2576756 RepID=A0A6N8HX07_9FIRM|nr:hypothetical protein [Caproicibacter fermentans]MVB10135.1 Nucleotide modification associated domain 3 [Caproicibacter fermentans]
MKIILSRKGFDSANGGCASPILEDGTLLSMPIPVDAESPCKYEDLYYNGVSYLSLLSQIKHNFTDRYCHLDPDIRKDCMKRSSNWQPLFGQCGAAQTHLRNNNVGSGDIFLFFGLFRRTIKHSDGTLHFTGPNMQIIFGYFQIGDVIEGEKIKQYHWHPHSRPAYYKKVNNCLYVPSNTLIFNQSLPGCGILSYDNKRVLTKPQYAETRWNLPEFFKEVSITYHNKESFHANYFQSVSRGQEFIVSEDIRVTQWAKNIICD